VSEKKDKEINELREMLTNRERADSSYSDF